MKTIKSEDYVVTLDDSQEAKDRVFETLLDWFVKVEMYSGESLGQSDTTYIEAPELLAKIAEKGFKFNVKWTEDDL